MHRRSVDLPEPDAPIRHTTSCSATTRSIPRSTSSGAERLVQALDPQGIGAADWRRPASGVAGELCGVAGGWRRIGHQIAPRPMVWPRSGAAVRPVPAGEPVDDVDERDGHHDEHERDRDVGREVVRRRRLDLGVSEDLDDPDERHEHGVLLEADEVVEQWRDHAPDGLRDDDVAERLEAGQPERAGGRLLARVDRLDAGAVDLGHVGRVDEGQREDPEQASGRCAGPRARDRGCRTRARR